MEGGGLEEGYQKGSLKQRKQFVYWDEDSARRDTYGVGKVAKIPSRKMIIFFSSAMSMRKSLARSYRLKKGRLE